MVAGGPYKNQPRAIASWNRSPVRSPRLLGAVYGRFGEGLNLQICGRRKRSSTNSREPTDQNVLGDQIVGGIKSLLNGTGDGYSSKWPPCVGQL
jgi:hypothetical protein